MLKPKIKMTERGFTLIEILLVLLIIGAVTATVVHFTQKNSPPESIFGKTGSGVQCKVTEEINFCVELSSTSIAPSDTFDIRVTVANLGAELFSTEQSFPSSCNAPTVEINSKDSLDIGVCTSDVSRVGIAPDKSITYDITVRGTDLKEGSNNIVLTWDYEKFASDAIVVERKPANEADQNKFASCLGEQSRKSYCTEVRIAFQDEYFNSQTTCQQLEPYVSELGVKAVQEYCGFSDIGYLIVYVPGDSSSDWITKIEQLPQVKEAF